CFKVQASGTSVRFTNFAFNLSNVPFVDQLLRSTVESELRAAIERAVRDELPPDLERALHGAVCAPQGRQIFGGTVVTMIFHPDRVVHDPDGIAVELSTLFVAPTSPFVAPAPGSLASTRPLPALG